MCGHQFSSVQFSRSVVSDCNPMDCSTPGFPVHRQLPEFTQTHVHRLDDAKHSFHPLSSLLLLLSAFPSIRVFSVGQLFTSGGQSFGVSDSPSVLPKNIRDSYPLGLDGSSLSPRDSQESSPTPQFKSIDSSMHSYHYSPTLTSIHYYWKNHSFD